MLDRVFVGSSKESFPYAEKIQQNLESSAVAGIEPVCWPTVFQLGTYILGVHL